jgi:transposase
MARFTEEIRQLAHHLHAHEPLEQGGRAGRPFRASATPANRPDQDRGRVARQHHHQGPPRRHGGFKKNGPQAIGKSRGGWTTKIHLVAANARCALTLALSPGQAGDGPEGRELLRAWRSVPPNCHLIMDRAYEGNETRQLALELGFKPVVPPNPNRVTPWEYDRAMYCKRNEVERLFRRLKGFRRVFSRFDKLDVMFMAFIHFALIFEALR